MSFVEKNKAWLLPLLAVGAGAVVYMNIRMMSTSPASPIPSPVGAEAPPSASSEVPASPELPAAVPSSPARTEPDAGPDLWADLRSMATPPPYLADENTFRDLARRSALAAIQDQPEPAHLVLPSGVREPQAPVKTAGTPEARGNSAPSPVPDLDFLIHGASGSRAWLDGKGYRPGQTLEGNPLSVGPIRSTTVELKSPSGKTRAILSTNPLHSPEPSPRPAVEAP